ESRRPMKFGSHIDRFGILKKLIVGGMGAVYLGFDPSDNGLVAVKVLLEEFASDATWVARFQREASILRKIDHPNIVRLVDAGIDGTSHYMALEYVRGV